MRGQRAVVVCRLCWALLLLGLVAASCGADSSAEDREDREEMLAVMRQEIVEALPEASPTQQEILADLHVTPGEADRVRAEVIECASARGVTVTLLPQESGRVAFETFGGRSDESMDAALAVFDECYESLFWLTGNALALQDALSSEETDRLNALVLDCLVAAGFDVGSWPDVRSEPDPSVESDCVDSAMSRLGNS